MAPARYVSSSHSIERSSPTEALKNHHGPSFFSCLQDDRRVAWNHRNEMSPWMCRLGNVPTAERLADRN
jgi:hypothetical protein